MRVELILVIALVILAFIIIVQPVLSAKNPEEQKQMPESRGKGLAEAIQHVPSFVAEKLKYMSDLFASGIRGIGQKLSEWIGTSFKPPGKNESQGQ